VALALSLWGSWRWLSLCGARGVGSLFVGPLLVGIHTYSERWPSLSGGALGLS
jgi:hypothetical protein